jgi:hypothetical protein
MEFRPLNSGEAHRMDSAFRSRLPYFWHETTLTTCHRSAPAGNDLTSIGITLEDRAGGTEWTRT